MRTTLLATVALVFLGALGPAPAAAQVTVSVSLPTVRFEVAPALVVVAPGIQVVPEHDHEVFFVGGHYWMLHDGHWYRARDWRHPKWKKWKKHDVPPGLRKLPPGKYKHWKAAKHHRKQHEKAEKRHEKRHDKAVKAHGKSHKKGHGKGKKKGR